MGKTGTRMWSFCLTRMNPRVRVRSPSIQEKCGSNSAISNEKVEGTGRKIMVVVDSSFEAKGALHWALSHTIQIQDTLILLHVIKPSKQGKGEEFGKEMTPRVCELVSSLKSMCQLKKPEVQIEMVVVVEGNEKGETIVKEARKQGAALLILGQKRQLTTWWFQMMMMIENRKTSRAGVVEYCIQNANCMAIAVRRKSKKLGGYLITTKRQKDFWLLA